MSQYFKTYFSPNRGAADQIIAFINRVPNTSTLDVAVYAITHDDIAAALVGAHRRGVVLRVLVDKVQASGQYSDDEKLIASGIDVRLDTQVGLMHHKVVIEGDRVVGFGSFNWTKGADTRNAENWNVCRLKYVVRQYREEFERLWALNEPDR